MSIPRWDDDMKFELLRLKGELRPENFKALAAPLGLGAIRNGKETPPPVRLPHLAQSPTVTPQALGASLMQPQRSLPLKAVPSTHEVPKAGKPGPAYARPGRTRPALARLVSAHLLDLGFVLLTLSLGLLVLGFVLDPQNMSWDLSQLQQAAPIQFVQKLQGLALILGVYTFFVLYWIFFKLVSGTTLGEAWLHASGPNENAGSPVPDNGSADS